MGSRCSFFPGLAFLMFGFLGFMILPAADAAIKKYQFDVSSLFRLYTGWSGDHDLIPSFWLWAFQVQVRNVSRLCHAKPIVTVNGMFPGPTIYAREGDRVIINVTNHAQYNMSIHWYNQNPNTLGNMGTWLINFWWVSYIFSCIFVGMELSNFVMVGLMDPLISHSVLSKLGVPTPMISM